MYFKIINVSFEPTDIVVDSGMGLANVYSLLLDKGVPSISFSFQAQFPFGNKTPDFLRAIFSKQLALIMERYPTISRVGIACNSLSFAIISNVDSLEQTHNVKIFSIRGMGAKRALYTTINDYIGIIGSEMAIFSDQHRLSIERENISVNNSFGEERFKDIQYKRLIGTELIDAIERGDIDDIKTEAKALFLKLFKPYKNDKSNSYPDVLVWGCTHFEAFDKVLREALTEVLIDEKININPFEIVFIMPGTELAYEMINANNSSLDLVGFLNNPFIQNLIYPMHFTNEHKNANGDIPLAYRYLDKTISLQYWGEE
ncbi:MAG: hypothetical protein WCH76_07745 [Candidatus Riflemargulisbacteria bacterium]